MVKRVIELGTLEDIVVLTGGVIKYNEIILEILAKTIEKEILTPPYPQLNGAVGAALFAGEAKD